MMATTALDVVGRSVNLISNHHTCSLFSRYPNSSPIRLQHRTHTFNLKRKKFLQTTASARKDELNQSFTGIYGKWQIEEKDLREVWSYRVSLSVVAAAFIANTAMKLLLHIPPPNSTELSTYSAVIGAGGLGVSLIQIHIYITEIKRVLQSLWIAGALGLMFILVQHSESSPIDYVIQNPNQVWYIGPLFAALSGICFKEGLCYGKLEAFMLSGLIPVLLLGHLTGWVPDSVEQALACAVSLLLAVFAARKYTQPVKDDIGDGSVFRFQAMNEDEKAALLKKLREED